MARARDRVRTDRKRFEATAEEKALMLRRFMAALDARDEQALSVFTGDATWTADGGGRVAASPMPIVGAPQIVRAVLGFTRNLNNQTMRLATVNGEPGLHVTSKGGWRQRWQSIWMAVVLLTSTRWSIRTSCLSQTHHPPRLPIR